jgi:hypothetical protein
MTTSTDKHKTWEMFLPIKIVPKQLVYATLRGFNRERLAREATPVKTGSQPLTSPRHPALIDAETRR